MRGQEQRRLPPTITYALHPLRLHTDDRHALQQDRTHIPALRESSHLPTFVLPAQHRIRHIQLLANERCLLIIDNSQGNFLIYLQNVKSLDGGNLNAVQCMKPLHHDKLGSDVIFAFDETTRLLSLCSVHTVRCSIETALLSLTSILSSCCCTCIRLTKLLRAFNLLM